MLVLKPSFGTEGRSDGFPALEPLSQFSQIPDFVLTTNKIRHHGDTVRSRLTVDKAHPQSNSDMAPRVQSYSDVPIFRCNDRAHLK